MRIEDKKNRGRRTEKGVPAFQSKTKNGSAKPKPEAAELSTAKTNMPKRDAFTADWNCDADPGYSKNRNSAADSVFAEIRLKPYKKDFSFSYSCGVFPTCELLNVRPDMLKKLVVTSDSLENAGVKKLIEGAEKLRVPVAVDDKTAERIYPKENTRAIGVFTKYETPLDPSANHVVLVNPSDMGNLGTIIRTMTAFELLDLAIITPAADVFDPKVIRASMGAFFHLRCTRFSSFEEYTASLAGNGTPSRAFYPFMLGGKTMESVKHPGGCFTLIFGNEASGLPESFSKVGSPVRIDHANTVDSLNLPVAASIGIYYFVKDGLHHE